MGVIGLAVAQLSPRGAHIPWELLDSLCGISSLRGAVADRFVDSTEQPLIMLVQVSGQSTSHALVGGSLPVALPLTVWEALPEGDIINVTLFNTLFNDAAPPFFVLRKLIRWVGDMGSCD